MLIVLCVDGLDPGLAKEMGLSLAYNMELEIPPECYVETPEGRTPHTTKIWPTMFSGRIIDYTATRRGAIRQRVHDFLVRKRLSWGGKKRYRVSPHNMDLETVFNRNLTYKWNIPTLGPEWVSSFPDLEAVHSFSRWEYVTFENLIRSAPGSGFDLFSAYTRLIDAMGHYDSERLPWLYRNVFDLATRTARSGSQVVLMSDHGCVDGRHTDLAYMGSSVEIQATNILDVRGELERLLDGRDV